MVGQIRAAVRIYRWHEISRNQYRFKNFRKSLLVVNHLRFPLPHQLIESKNIKPTWNFF